MVHAVLDVITLARAIVMDNAVILVMEAVQGHVKILVVTAVPEQVINLTIAFQLTS